MSNPIVYDRDYSFSGFQASNPTEPLPGDEIDGELDSIAASIADIAMKLRNVRRSDGALVNDIVTIDSLSDEVKALLGIGDINFIEPLAANRTYYIDPDGDDDNDGLDPDTSPFATIQKAVDAARGLNSGGHYITIQLAPGTYAGFALSGRLWNAFNSSERPFQIIGDVNAPEDYIIQGVSGNAVDLWDATLYLAGVTITTVTGGYGMLVRQHTILELGNVRIDDVASEMIACQSNSVITLAGTLDVVGDANSFCHVTLGGHVILTNRTVNFSKPGGNSFAAYVWGLNAAKVNADGTTFTGTIIDGNTTIHDRSLFNGYSSDRSGMTTSLYGPGEFNVEDGSVVTDTLQQTLNYYVNPLGSDNNDGLANTAARAFKTIQGALDRMATFPRDANKPSAGFSGKVNIADGTYSEVVKLRTMAAFESVRIIGNVSTPANVVIAGTTDAINGTNPVSTVYSIEDCTITAAAGSGLRAEGGTVITFKGVKFGACSVAHMQANTGGKILCKGDYTFGGNAACHVLATNGGIVDYGADTITASLWSNAVFSVATVALSNLSVAHIDSGNVTWSLGAFSVTGKRFGLTGLSMLDTDGGTEASYIPGDSSGTKATSSVYA